MRFILKLGIICAMIYGFVFCAELISDKAQLKNQLIRVHIVANSDSQPDQQIKLQVRDGILSYLQPAMETIADKEEAFRFIRENISNLEEKANQVLMDLGENKKVSVSLTREEFDVRKYDTFSLPSGIYDTLRVQIGEGEGKNWWCVAFPTLCMPATTEAFADTAASSGFSDALVNTVSNNERYELRFFFLDLLGKVENFFH